MIEPRWHWLIGVGALLLLACGTGSRSDATGDLVLVTPAGFRLEQGRFAPLWRRREEGEIELTRDTEDIVLVVSAPGLPTKVERRRIEPVATGEKNLLLPPEGGQLVLDLKTLRYLSIEGHPVPLHHLVDFPNFGNIVGGTRPVDRPAHRAHASGRV